MARISFTSSPTHNYAALRTRLLGGASAAALVLGMVVMAPAGAVADEIAGDAATPTDLSANTDAITNTVDGTDVGAIDTDGGITFPSITLTEDAQIFVFDSNGTSADDAATITGDIDIGADDTLTITFGVSGGPTAVPNPANVTVEGNIVTGGDLILGVGDDVVGATVDGSAGDGSTRFDFTVDGSSVATNIDISAGNANATGAGAAIRGTFGSLANGTDGLIVTGGAGDAGGNGGSASVLVLGDAEVNGIVSVVGGLDGGAQGGSAVAIFLGNVDAGGIILQEGPVTGAAGLFFSGSSNQTVNGAINVNEDGFGFINVAAGDGTRETVTFVDQVGGANAIGVITIGEDTPAGRTDDVTAVFQGGVFADQFQIVHSGDSATFNVNSTVGTITGDGFFTIGGGRLTVTGDIANTGASSITAGNALTVGDDGTPVTVTPDIDGAAGTDLTIDNNADVTFSGVLGGSAPIEQLTIGNAASATFAADATFGRVVSSPGAFTVGNGTDPATLTILGDVENAGDSTIASGGTLVLDSTGGAITTFSPNLIGGEGTTLETTGGNGVTFGTAAVIGQTNAIETVTIGTDTTFSAGQLNAVNMSVAGGFTATVNGTAVANITGDLTGEGTFDVDVALNLGAAGQMSTVSIAAIEGDGTLDIVDDSMVTISSIIGAVTPVGTFSSDGANTELTINTDVPGGDAIQAGTLELSNGTIILGASIGDGDTVFDVTDLDDGGSNTSVELSSAFTDGVITFVQSDDANEGATNAADFTPVDTVLTDFTIRANGGDDTIIEIEAVAESDASIAAALGISLEEAEALREAVEGASAEGDTEGVDAISEILNDANNAATALAAESVGTQGDGLAGGSGVAFATTGEQQRVLTGRLGRLASIFSNGGFSGGDLITGAPVGTPEPTGGFWLQGFGGVANADGDSTVAGYDGNFGGVMIGVDGEVADGVTIGAYGAYSVSSVDGDGSGDVEVDTTSFGFGVYAGYTTDMFYVDGFASYTASDNDMTRTAFVGGLTRNLSADYDSSLWSVGINAGVPLEVSTNVFVTPQASLTANSYNPDSYTESGTGFTQTVNPDSVTQVTGTIGARIHAVYENMDGTTITPELRVALVGDLNDDDPNATVSFTGGGATYQVSGTDVSDIGAQIGVGVSFENENWIAGISYDADLRSDYNSHTGRAEIRWKF